MKTDDLRKRIEVLLEQRAWIDNAITILESQLEALEMQELQEREKERHIQIPNGGTDRVEGSYILQKVKCGKPTCHCAKPDGELHGPYWYLYTKRNGKSRSKYLGKNKPVEA